jgi:hypothetical protein
MNSPALLHNMSVAPRTNVCHTAPPRSGHTIAFRVPAGVKVDDAVEILALLDGQTWPGSARNAEVELRQRLNRCAADLPYPPAVLVTRDAAPTQEVPDLLIACTLLAKSSDRVYLREKEPDLSRIASGRSVVLHISANREDK